MKSLLMKDKRGVAGFGLAKSVVVTLLVLVILSIVTVVVVAALKNSNIMTANSSEYNATQNIANNLTSGLTSFFGNTITWFSIISVVIIILLISVVILVITGWEGGRGVGRGAGSL